VAFCSYPITRPPRPPLFPYTTLFRSTVNAGGTLRASGDLGDGNDTFTLAGTLATGGAALNLGDGNDVFTLNDGGVITGSGVDARSEEHTSELQSRENLVCRLLLEKKN